MSRFFFIAFGFLELASSAYSSVSLVDSSSQDTDEHQELGSSWDGLNSLLVAKIYAVEYDGTVQSGSSIVKGIFADDLNLDIALNWNSPFESAGAESKAPALMAMLQSGALQSVVESANLQDSSLSSAISYAKGRTGITKLNSTQVFNGMPPVKIQGTLVFRAWADSLTEVEEPLQQLIQWSLPYSLAGQTTMLSRGIDTIKNGDATVQQVMDIALPSKAPTLVGITYKGRTYAPLVIESVGVPLHSPIDASGYFVKISLPITFGTLTSIDQDDWSMAGINIQNLNS